LEFTRENQEFILLAGQIGDLLNRRAETQTGRISRGARLPLGRTTASKVSMPIIKNITRSLFSLSCPFKPDSQTG
jgi:hypothetical protein